IEAMRKSVSSSVGRFVLRSLVPSARTALSVPIAIPSCAPGTRSADIRSVAADSRLWITLSICSVTSRVPAGTHARRQANQRKSGTRPARRTAKLLSAETIALRGRIRVSAPSSRAISTITLRAILQTIALPTELPRRDLDSIRYFHERSSGLARHGVGNHVRRRRNGLRAPSTRALRPLLLPPVSNDRNHCSPYTIAPGDLQETRPPATPFEP